MGPKPDWLSWKDTLAWLRRAEVPLRTKPLSSAEDRARFAALLAAHECTRDSQGRIIPSSRAASATASQQPPQETQRPSSRSQLGAHDNHQPVSSVPPQAPLTPSRLPGDAEHTKAASQAAADHHRRQDANPYLQQPVPSQQAPQPQGDDPTPLPSHRQDIASSTSSAPQPSLEAVQHGQQDAVDNTKLANQARADHQQRQRGNPYLHGSSNLENRATMATKEAGSRPKQAPAIGESNAPETRR